jgi:hypothetical protein
VRPDVRFQFLLTKTWWDAEGDLRGVVVSDEEVRTALREQWKQAFPRLVISG